jgi:fibrillarin-like pre-rRNA processing protein
MQKVVKSKIFEVFESGDSHRKKIYTKSLAPRVLVYNEKIVRDGNEEFREWDPTRSKLSAFILKGALNTGIRKGDVVLYLGASTGTTVSHVSDIVGREGFVYALDFAPRVVRELFFVAKSRPNIAPLLEDAFHPETYADKITGVDVVYQDIAQREQVEIFLKNCRLFLKPGGYGLLAVKARSVDVTQPPKTIFNAVRAHLEKTGAIIADYRLLDPFEKDHAMFLVKIK